MNHDYTFRIALIVGALFVLPVAAYYRIRSQLTGEKLDRWQEGAFILFTLRPLAACAAVGLFAFMIKPQYMAWSALVLPVWLRWCGIGLSVLAGCLLLWTFRNLGKNLTDTVVTRKAHTLVSTGPYRWIRHPFYVAGAMFVLGNALAAANWFMLVTGSGVILLLVLRTRREEAELLRRFGDSYRAYVERTGRFLPKLSRSLLAIFLWSCLVLVRAHAQAQQTTFATEVNYVDVDAIVTDQDGNPVSGLTIDDFELFEDGQARKIDTFSYVDIPVSEALEFPGVDRPVSTDVRSNQDPATGRMYLIVLDDANIEPLYTARVKQHAREFIEQYFGPGDIAAVAYTSGTTDASQDFTGDSQMLLASIDRFAGRRSQSAAVEAANNFHETRLTLQIDPPPGLTPEQVVQLAVDLQDSRRQTLGQTAKPTVDIRDFERAQRAVNVLNTLQTLADSLSAVPGRRKALVMFSEGIGYQLDEPFGMRSVTDVLRATQDAINMAGRANVNFYMIDPRGLVGTTSDLMQMTGAGLPDGGTPSAILEEFKTSQNSLRVLAEETGGFAALDSNSFASAFERIFNSNSRYYMLGYRRPDHAPNGAFHSIDLRVKRPGLKVTARRGYASPRARTVEEARKDEASRRAREAKRPGANNTSNELRAVLDSPIQKSGLTLSVHAAPFRNTDKEASVAMSIEVGGEPLLAGGRSQGPSKLELSFYGINENGRAGPGIRKELDLAMKPETSERVKVHGIRLNPRIPLAPGRYQMRIGARETAGGQSGSVFYDLIVPDFRKGELAMSGLLLSSVSAQQAPTAEPDAIASKQLPGAATSRRRFPVGDTLAVYAELYDNGPARQPRQIDVLVRLISENGIDVFAAKDSMASSAPAPSNVFAQFALEDLEAGVYLLRVEARLSGTVQSLVARETLITVER